ncbi:MAG: hypothetical protein PHF70_13220 [Opitutales bacterium]|nr:hypothetical protein [Opitutales bacterium]
MDDPAIVVMGYQRVESLRRLLDSLFLADYQGRSVSLVVSIDKGNNAGVESLVKGLRWPYGPLELVFRTERLGLRDHVYACADLVNRFGSIVMLEDDLFVAPGFYDLACHMVQKYGHSDRVAGMALYHHAFNETSKMRFWPLKDGSDAYFLQLAASWGQCWTADQWNRFKDWSKTQTHETVTASAIPWDMRKWPWSSWKKWYTAFMVDTERYVVYPRYSMTTNFMDIGENHHETDATYQRDMMLGFRNWHLPDMDDNALCYDSYGELEPCAIKRLCPGLSAYDFSVDLGGMKPLDSIETPYLLSLKPCLRPIRTYGRLLRPSEWNVISRVDGDELAFGQTKDFLPLEDRPICKDINYHYGVPSKLLGRMFLQRLENKPFASVLRMLYRAITIWKPKRNSRRPTRSDNRPYF